MSLRRVAATVALLLLALPNLALAGGVAYNPGDRDLGTAGRFRYRVDTAAYGGARFGEAFAGCGGQGWRAIGGGAAVLGDPDASWLAVTRSGDSTVDVDTDRDDGWEAGGFGEGGEGVRSWSICLRDDAVGLAYARSELPDGAASRYGSAECPTDAWAMVSGGGLIATTGSWLAASWPADDADADAVLEDAWWISAWDTLGGIGGLYVYGVCAIGAGPLTTRHGAESAADAGTTTTVEVRCTRKTHVVGGGAWIEGTAAEVRLLASGPFDGPDADRTPDDGWRVRLHRLPGTPAGSASAWATCLP